MSITLDEKNFARNSGKNATEYRNWKIWWWDDKDEKHIEFIKQKELNDIIKYCQFKRIIKYSIFDDCNKNVCNDGESVLMG